MQKIMVSNEIVDRSCTAYISSKNYDLAKQKYLNRLPMPLLLSFSSTKHPLRGLQF